ncbi:MAG: type II toxin-antitoxin system VapC family toxin [Acidobacteria bacterium]|nr:type II toxin-antitoxin system VapC family toxin [Acidobacteriota bacterium]
MTAGWLLDTNILLYISNPGAAEHFAATASVGRLLAAGDRLAVAPQVFFELWSVATRPVTANGLGWSVARARAEVEVIRSRFLVLEEPPVVVDLWLDIVARHGLKGKRVHDAHLMATMKANGVTRLLTFKAADFPAEPGISIFTPEP